MKILSKDASPQGSNNVLRESRVLGFEHTHTQTGTHVHIFYTSAQSLDYIEIKILHQAISIIIIRLNMTCK